ncbi:ATP-binding protein [Streptomyces antimycoticus]|uniref:ATP-binding protein n=1 Tax=Streptomyces antimycoticus TaxID=68175 RepID=UPI00342DD7D0
MSTSILPVTVAGPPEQKHWSTGARPATSHPAGRPASPPADLGEQAQPPSVPGGSRRAASSGRAVLALPAEISWVPVVRHCVRAVLAQWRFPADDRESAELIVTELAANAAQHGRREMTVRLTLHPGVLRISVTDSGATARPPRPRDTNLGEHGRGLSIVGFLAHEVRVHQWPLGRRVDVVLRPSAPEPVPVGV